MVRWHPTAGTPSPNPLPKRIRQLVSIFEDTDLEDALATMRRSGAHLARLLDRDGAVEAPFLEDIVEELVGEVQDATRRGGGRAGSDQNGR